jgi:hypothetical protein
MQDKIKIFFFGLIILLLTNNIYSQIRINEIAASNDTSLYDENQKSPDWIELYNSSEEDINLKNYRIFNKNDYEKAWVLPDTVVKSKGHLVVFASNEKRNESGNLVIEASGYGITSWNHKECMRFDYIPVKGDFDIWLNFNSIRDYEVRTLAALMVRDNLEATSRFVGIVCENKDKGSFSVFHRLTEGKACSVLPFYNRNIEYPDCKVRLTRQGDTITAYVWDRNCCWLTEPDKSIVINFSGETAYVGIGFSSGNVNLTSKLTVSEIHLNNKLVPFSDLKSIELETNKSGRRYLSKEIHTNFVLEKDGETVYLWNSEGMLADSLTYPKLRSDVSYGRYPDGKNIFKYFAPTSPEKENEEGYMKICEPPDFSLGGGWYSSKQFVGFLTNEQDVSVYYTVDGSSPDLNSAKFIVAPIKVDTNMVIRARTYGEDCLPSEIVTKSFFINDSSTLPVISLSVSEDDLWNSDYGIFVPKNLQNSQSGREVPVHFELWNKSKNLIFSTDAGAKVHGWLSSSFPQKSLRLYARSRYGSSNFKIPFFGEYGLKEYERIVLRNGGTEWWRSMLRDAFSAVVTKKYFPYVDAMAYTPTLMFMNGSFYGIQNIRERLDEYYLGRKFGIPPESIDLMEDWDKLKAGSAADYLKMADSTFSYNMKKSDAFDFISRNIDVENLIDYTILNVYFSNVDWPFHNLKYWKSSALDNRWRWVMYDLDYSCGIAYPWDYNNIWIIADSTNNFAMLMPKLLENEEFKTRFINRTADLHNTVFKPEKMIPIIDSLAEMIRPEIPRQQAKYDSSAMNWEMEINDIRRFLNKRPRVFPVFIAQYFGLKDTAHVRLDVVPTNSGKIMISTIVAENYPWDGVYYQGVPVVVQITAKKGYRFVGWNGSESYRITDTLMLNSDTVMTAFFEQVINPDTNIVINEIMYKPNENEDSDDWVGLYNAGKGIDISGWIFKDDNDNHIFVLPENSYFPEDDYLVLCRYSLKFSRVNPGVTKVYGNFDFGLGEKDAVRLFDRGGNLVDFVYYDSKEPWPTNSNGTGNSIELINPYLDNELAENWRSSLELNGTPGKINSTYVGVESQDLADNLYVGNYPNPFSGETSIEFNIRYADKITLSIYNSLGELVEKLAEGQYYNEGKYYIRYENKMMEQGVFYIKLETSRETKVNQMVKIK